MNPRAELSGLFHDEGIELLGVAGVAEGGDDDSGEIHRSEINYRKWITAGYHGEMEYLRRHANAKYRPDRVMPGCRSVIVAGMSYYQEPSKQTPAQPAGRVARYAWGRDYHLSFGKRLKRIVGRLIDAYPEHKFRSFLDASPLSERHYAAEAGIGFTGKNTLTISTTYGSYFFVGEVLSTKEYATRVTPQPQRTCPSSCFRCGAACPTNALFEPFRLNASRCISYLTIEHKGSISVELRRRMGDWVFGCDLCQDACPLNVSARKTDNADFTTPRAGESIEISSLLALSDDEAFRSRFAGTPVMRAGRVGMIRNGLIAAANTRARELVPLIRHAACDENAIIREHARWAIGELGADP